MTQSIEKAISEMKKHSDQVQDAMAGSNCGDLGPPIAGVRAHPLLIHRAAPACSVCSCRSPVRDDCRSGLAEH